MKGQHSEKGATLAVVTMVVGALAVLSVCALTYTMLIAKNVRRTNTYREAVSTGDGALQHAFAYWRETCRQRTNIFRPGKDFAALTPPTTAMFNLIPGFTASTGANPANGTPYTIANFKIEVVTPQYLPCDQNAAAPTGTGMSVGSRSAFYKASADVSLPTSSGFIQVKLRQIFEKQILSPWNYAIFYADDLEIHPGPIFTVSGWVHSNSNVYTGHNTLSFLSKMSYGDNWKIGFSPLENTHSGEVPANPSYPSNLPPTREQGQQPYGLDAQRIFSTTDTNPNNDSYREILDQAAVGYPDPFTDITDPDNPRKARYYDQAGVKIRISGTNGTTVVIKNAEDTTITSSSTGNDKLLYDMVNAALITNQNIQDAREAATVRLTTLDLSKFYTALKPGGTMSGAAFNGVVYISDTTAAAASTSQRRGIRLKNGQFIAAPGLTIASDNAIYIQGDYNTGISPPSNLTGNANDPTKPTGIVSTGILYNKQPCAVIGDAVMFLSNAWVDSNSSATLSSRDASNTTINTAIISGIVPSGSNGTNYSGGAENFPRFLEDWGSSAVLTYYGSMIELYKSRYHISPWGGSNVYSAPIRKWYFDTLFYTAPPPGTLDLVLYKKGLWYNE
ncbi:MAG: hypothetical protein JWL59_2708 [Chthoniobacteraceae bacterium]|nr:hypothetical protein [Chthoniobacteraceae bacterium]